MNIDLHIIVGITVALGCGMLIGIEREKRKATGPRRAQAGVRTFSLVAIAGALAQALHQPWLIIIGALMILLLAFAAYWHERSNDPGITTDIALLITFMLGIAAIDFPLMSAGIAVVTTGLLASKNFLHHFSSKVLSESELRDALYLAASALVVLPLLPDQAASWLAGANPRRLWGLVVLLMSLQACGYVALRIAGAKLGLALSGLASGFVSSTATIIAMGARARKDPSLLNVSVSGALFSNVATFCQLFVVTVAIYPSMLGMLTPYFLTGLLVAVIVAGISYRRNGINSDGLPTGRAFSLIQAVEFAIILSVVTTVIAFVDLHYGQTAVSVGSALAGFADVHAATASALSLGAKGTLPPAELLFPILLAFTTNTISKLTGAFAAGGIRYGARVGAGLVAALIAVWICYLLFR